MASARSLTGPRLPAASGKATDLVVLCHGYGADGNDLIGLAPHWGRALPTVAFAAPNAPERCQGAPSGYQWFAISNRNAGSRNVEAPAALLNEFIDSELARLDLPSDRFALVGFSQGAMMSLHVGLARPSRPKAILSYSGLLAGAERFGELTSSEVPPILLVHGDADPMIPADMMFESAIALGSMGARVQWHLSLGLGHSIDQTGLEMGARFLALAFRGRLKAASPYSSRLALAE